MLFQIPYILAEAPSNLLIKGVRPSVWQARIMVRKNAEAQKPPANWDRSRGE